MYPQEWADVEFPPTRWPVTAEMEITHEHFEDLRKAIYRRFKGGGIWPFYNYSYSQFDYFMVGGGPTDGDWSNYHGIRGDYFSGKHWMWQSEYEERQTYFDGLGVWLEQNYGYTCGGSKPTGKEHVYTPLWVYLPMQTKHMEDNVDPTNDARTELNWFKAYSGFPWATLMQGDMDGRDFAGVAGVKKSPDPCADDKDWFALFQPKFQSYRGCIEYLMEKVRWVDKWKFDATISAFYGPQPVWYFKRIGEIVTTRWPTRMHETVMMPTCPEEDSWNNDYLQNGGDYFLWLAQERYGIELDTWLDTYPVGDGIYSGPVVRPMWKEHSESCGQYELDFHSINDLMYVLLCMQYIQAPTEIEQFDMCNTISQLKRSDECTVTTCYEDAYADFKNAVGREEARGANSGFSCEAVCDSIVNPSGCTENDFYWVYNSTPMPSESPPWDAWGGSYWRDYLKVVPNWALQLTSSFGRIRVYEALTSDDYVWDEVTEDWIIDVERAPISPIESGGVITFSVAIIWDGYSRCGDSGDDYENGSIMGDSYPYFPISANEDGCSYGNRPVDPEPVRTGYWDLGMENEPKSGSSWQNYPFTFWKSKIGAQADCPGVTTPNDSRIRFGLVGAGYGMRWDLVFAG